MEKKALVIEKDQGACRRIQHTSTDAHELTHRVFCKWIQVSFEWIVSCTQDGITCKIQNVSKQVYTHMSCFQICTPTAFGNVNKGIYQNASIHTNHHTSHVHTHINVPQICTPTAFGNVIKGTYRNASIHTHHHTPHVDTHIHVPRICTLTAFGNVNTSTDRNAFIHTNHHTSHVPVYPPYGVATISRLLTVIGLLGRI